MASGRRRVVVTGMGMVTPVGSDVESSWTALREGRGGVGPITLFDASTFATRIAAEVKGFSLDRLSHRRPAVARPLPHDAVRAGRRDHGHGARRAGGARRGRPKTIRRLPGLGRRAARLPVVRRSRASLDPGRRGRQGALHGARASRRLHPTREAEQEPGTPAGYLAGVFGARGHNATCLTACAASAQAIGEAVEVIRRGAADVILTGGTHSMIHPFGLTGFILLTAMSTRNDDPGRASRPFDRDRDGFLLGEGGGMLVLEELEHARARGAVIHGEVAGHASTADAFRLTDSHDEGRGAVAAMQGALADAGLEPEDVDYINAHGTSTKSNDSVETLAIKRVMGDRAFDVPVSSTKSMTGHLVAAGGAVEAIICLLAIRDGVVPPTINLEHPDPGCDLDYVPNVAREQAVDVALSNSFGFGGQNTALVIRRFVG